MIKPIPLALGIGILAECATPAPTAQQPSKAELTAVEVKSRQTNGEHQLAIQLGGMGPNRPGYGYIRQRHQAMK